MDREKNNKESCSNKYKFNFHDIFIYNIANIASLMRPERRLR